MNQKFNWAGFISIALLFSFVVMMFSGVVLYIAPEGSLARWIGWDVLGLTKSQWEQQHTIFSYLFVIFIVLHIFKINWVLLWSYFFAEKLKFVYLKEILIAVAITLVVFTGTLMNIDPFRFVIKAGNTLSENFGTRVERPDIPDPEKLTVEQFVGKLFNLTYADFLEVARKLHLEVDSEDQTIEDFSKKNNISPEELYLILKNEIPPERLN
ncbi:MAG: DUF4405 domain-containing protein [Bacteroidales bacterium]|jgi:hypothetical protein|nr:DUF4405 domain-containing protein [Bacteroidales bacterium]